MTLSLLFSIIIVDINITTVFCLEELMHLMCHFYIWIISIMNI